MTANTGGRALRVPDDVDTILRTELGRSTTMPGRRREQQRANRFDHPELAERTDA